MPKGLYPEKLERLIINFKMTDEEIDKIMESVYKSPKLVKTIRYYHFGDKNAYKE